MTKRKGENRGPKPTETLRIIIQITHLYQKDNKIYGHTLYSLWRSTKQMQNPYMDKQAHPKSTSIRL